jgi:hypothetical protein
MCLNVLALSPRVIYNVHMSIHNIRDKIKGYGYLDKTGLLYVLLVLGVGIASFGLGRLSVAGIGSHSDNGDILISDSLKASVATLGVAGAGSVSSNESQLGDQSVRATSMSNSGSYVASKSGKLYYTASCSGAKRILNKNKVWFDAASDAEKSGYTRATSCK